MNSVMVPLDWEKISSIPSFIFLSGEIYGLFHRVFNIASSSSISTFNVEVRLWLLSIETNRPSF